MDEATDKNAVRPFHVAVPEAELTELRRRIDATRWPERETVSDFSQGVPQAKMQKLARYWATDYDWRKVEARLNSYPQFITEIDGLDIQFLHVRSKHESALPVIVTHGWPGSIIEQLKIIDPLSNSTAHGGSAADAFHVVIPSASFRRKSMRLPLPALRRRPVSRPMSERRTTRSSSSTSTCTTPS